MKVHGYLQNQCSNRSQAAVVDLNAAMNTQDEFRRNLRIPKWKESGATLSEEEIAELANIASE